MEKVILEDLKPNSKFHFTYVGNQEEIENRGLVPTIGENALGIEETPKIFFSEGLLGILKVNEVWLRWLMNRIYGYNDRLGIQQELSKEEKAERLHKWTDEFLSNEYLEDKEKKDFLFDYYYQYLKDRVYYVLDIEDGKEYDSNDIDENKVRLLQQSKGIAMAFAKVMYGSFSDMKTPIMDDWNMHTKKDVVIPKEKIKQVQTKEGQTDMLSILVTIYEKNKHMPHNKLLLDDFIEYAKRREELERMTSEEGDLIDQNNLSRAN